MSSRERSPLKDKPLRLPGQSLEEERRKLFEDKLELPAFMAISLVGIAWMEWWHYYSDRPPQPILLSLIALGAIAFVGWRFWRLLPRFRALRQGMEGERAVGQYLERLRERGYLVFHDVIGSGFNVDHVLIGPAGVFTVETKTRSKPLRGEARVRFDGERILVGGHEPDRDPVVQAKAQAAWLRELLAESTGRKFAVRPVIVFPGWYVEQPSNALRDLWVLEPKALPPFLEKEAQVLMPVIA